MSNQYTKQTNSNAVIITHGDVYGMVCAAQLIRLEKSKFAQNRIADLKGDEMRT